MKHLLIALLFLPLIPICNAQDDKGELKDGEWKLKGVTGLNMSQTALSNWSAGGENSLAGNLYLNGGLKRKSGHWLWENSLVLDYGLTTGKSQGVRKTSDNIDFSTKLGYSANNKWYYTVMGDLKTQFYKGYDYPDKTHYISKFFAPAYSNLSVGMEYRPKDYFSLYLSPVAGKLTFVQDDYLSSLGAFGVDPGDKFRGEFGAYIKTRFEKEIIENVRIITSADFFTAYDSSFGNVDVNWDMMINMKINKFMSATLNTTLKYDNDVKIKENGVQKGPKVQFKEMLGVGFSYNF